MLRRAQPSKAVLPRRARSTRLIGVVVAWEIVVVVALALVLQRQIWSTALAAVLVLVALLLSIPVNGRTLVATFRIRREFATRRVHRVEAPDVATELVPLAQWLPDLELTQIKDAHDGEIGVVADGHSWCGILEISADNSLFTDRGAKLDLGVLASLGQQDDVVFSGIQVITFTVPAPSTAMLPENSPAVAAYREIVGANPPPAVRRTWIALRLDPRLCLEAVGRRGSGQVGVFATLRFGLHRAQATLKRNGVLTEPLDPLGISDVLTLTTGSSDQGGTQRSREEWEQWICDTLVHETRGVAGFTAAPSVDYQGLLDVATLTPAMFVVTSLTVSPGEPPIGAIRLVTASTEQAAAADEFTMSSIRGHLRVGPRGGNQVPGLLATVPLGRRLGR